MSTHTNERAEQSALNQAMAEKVMGWTRRHTADWQGHAYFVYDVPQDSCCILFETGTFIGGELYEGRWNPATVREHAMICAREVVCQKGTELFTFVLEEVRAKVLNLRAGVALADSTWALLNATPAQICEACLLCMEEQ